MCSHFAAAPKDGHQRSEVRKMSVELLDTPRFHGFRVRRQIAGKTFQEYFSLKENGKRIRGARRAEIKAEAEARDCRARRPASRRPETRRRERFEIDGAGRVRGILFRMKTEKSGTERRCSRSASCRRGMTRSSTQRSPSRCTALKALGSARVLRRSQEDQQAIEGVEGAPRCAAERSRTQGDSCAPRRVGPSVDVVNYADLHAASLADPAAYWLRAARAACSGSRRLRRPSRRGVAGTARWFPDGVLNTAWLCLDAHVDAGRGDEVALIYDSPVTDTIERLTFAELTERVARTAGALRALGVERGDRVIIYMPIRAGSRDCDACLRAARRNSFGRVRWFCCARSLRCVLMMRSRRYCLRPHAGSSSSASFPTNRSLTKPCG